MKGKLYGVGVGPGDADLLTLKAVEVLEKVDYICAPQTGKKEDSLALKIVQENINCKDKVMKLNFPMIYSKNDLNYARDVAALKIRKKLAKGKDLAFITIGDPLLYSTYIYILTRLNNGEFDFSIQTIPGITSFSACMASCNLPLAKNNENIAILPDVKDEEMLENTLKNFSNTIIMKLSKNFDKVYKILNRLQLKENTIMASRCGHKEEAYVEDIDNLSDKDIDYLSLFITKNN
ncbi:MAG: precorrin-2 C(20)-methyltransferase [Bacillota bacterium]